MEWASQIWNDPDGTKGSVIPVVVRPTSNIPPLLRGLSRIDLTNCSEDQARDRLIKGVAIPAPPERKPAFAKIIGEPPDNQHSGPPEKPTFVQVTISGDLIVRFALERLCRRVIEICEMALGKDHPIVAWGYKQFRRATSGPRQS
jgi:hypothetical protein